MSLSFRLRQPDQRVAQPLPRRRDPRLPRRLLCLTLHGVPPP